MAVTCLLVAAGCSYTKTDVVPQIPANAQTSQPSVLAGRYRMAVRSACAFDRIFTDGFDPLA